MKKKILFIGWTTGGGVATINNEVMKIFRNAGHECGLIDLERMKSRYPAPLAYLFAYIVSFFRILRERPDVVYLQCAQTGYLHQSIFLLIAKALGRETVAHFHAKSDLAGTTTKGQRGRILFSERYTDRMILLTEPCRESLVGSGWKKKTFVVPNFIGTENLPGSVKPAGERRFILYLGRMNGEKGIYEVLEAARRLGDERFVFVGNIDNDADRERFAGELGRTENAEWLGPIYGDEKYGIIADSKFLLLPTRRDEFPMILIESTILGCVPLVSRVGSVGEIVRDGYNGFYISPDDVGGIVDTIRRWRNDPGLQAVSENGIRFARGRFTSDAVGPRLLEAVG
ncbi:MAG: glycosyltransferase family 4 protein [Candidatus Krumholzibacteria bacterium]|nr:glycosyltransferase family 4 protein [Candidatus Krumholzibacteria bacterium]